MTEFRTVENLLIKAGIPTANGRIYPADVIENAVRKLDSARTPVMGHIGLGNGSRTRLANVSHQIHDLRISSQGIMAGEVEILDTPQGRILQEMFDTGRVLTLNPCFTGSVDNNVVVDDLILNYVNICYMSDHDSMPMPTTI